MKKESEKQRRPDVIRDNEVIRKHIKSALEKIEWNGTDLIELAESTGRKIDHGALSRYLNADKSNRSILSQEDVLWLCRKLKIEVIFKIQSK